MSRPATAWVDTYRLSAADRHAAEAVRHLTEYIKDRILEAGNEYKLAERTGIPRTTIQTTLREGGILALRKLAYRLAEAKRKKS